MKVSLVTGSKAHTLDLARELEKRGLFHELIIGYPKVKLHPLNGIPERGIVTSPYFHSAMILLMKAGLGNSSFLKTLERIGNRRLDNIAAGRLEGVDVLISMAGAGIVSGPSLQKRGGHWICDRGAAHIAWQKRILDAEYAKLGIGWQGISPDKVAREAEEYAGADLIYVPSEFVRRTFLEEGVAPEKVEVHKLGVDLAAFQAPGERPANEVFTILGAGQMGVQKGLHILRDALRHISAPVRLQWAGVPLPEAGGLVRDIQQICDFQVLGHQSTADLARIMGRADVFVLPSVQDGFGMVATQAMACATPIIVSDAAGAAELIRPGENGLVFPSGDAAALASHLENLREDGEARRAMGERGRQTVNGLGGWGSYGDSVAASLANLRS